MVSGESQEIKDINLCISRGEGRGTNKVYLGKVHV